MGETPPIICELGPKQDDDVIITRKVIDHLRCSKRRFDRCKIALMRVVRCEVN